MANKASELFTLYQNPNGPDITTVVRPIIEADGLYFKDIDGTGTVSEVNDWRLPSAQRAAAYVKQLTLDEQIGQLFISDWRMGPKYPSARLKGHVAVADESGCVDEAAVHHVHIALTQVAGFPAFAGSFCPLVGNFDAAALDGGCDTQGAGPGGEHAAGIVHTEDDFAVFVPGVGSCLDRHKPLTFLGDGLQLV